MASANEWRKRAAEAAEAEAVELTLPSGMAIRARRPDPLQLAAWGALPMGLASAAAGLQESATRGDRIERGAELASCMRELLIWCCVSPRVSLQPQSDEEIHPREIPYADWTHIVFWALRVEEVRALEGFRGERGDAGRDRGGEGVRDAAERTAGDPGSGRGLEF